MPQSELIYMRVRGPRQMFDTGAIRAEPFSSPTPSQSGVYGICSAICSHAGANYFAEWCALLFHPRYVPVTMNEIKNFGNGCTPVDVEHLKNRTQRTRTFVSGKPRLEICPHTHERTEITGIDQNTLEPVTLSANRLFCPHCGTVSTQISAAGKTVYGKIVSDVDHLIAVRVVANNAMDLAKYRKMFLARLRNGHFHRPVHLGIRECDARYVEQVDEEDLKSLVYPEIATVDHGNFRSADFSVDLGLTWYGTDWADPAHPNYFAPLTVNRGVVRYPSWEQVRELGIRREGFARIAA